MRRLRLPLFAVLAVLAVLVLLGRPARAGDDLPGANAAPGFPVAEVALGEAALPADGSLKAGPADAPESDEAKTIAGFLQKTAKDKGSEAWTTSRAFVTADGKPVTLVLADTLGDGDGVLEAVKAGAAKNGWAVRTIAFPSRIAVVAGPEGVREKVLDLQIAFAIKHLGMKLARALDEHEGASYDLANTLLKLEPKHALAHVTAGYGLAQIGAREKDASIAAQAPGHFKAALAADAASPLTGEWLVRAKGMYGDSVLNAADGKPSAEARDLLAEAVKGAAGSKLPAQMRAGWRYNLACAHARLGEKDPAFEHLTAVLAENAEKLVEGISHWRKDPDFANLKDDPRWKALTDKYPPKKGEDEDGEGGMEGGEGGMEGGGGK